METASPSARWPRRDPRWGGPITPRRPSGRRTSCSRPCVAATACSASSPPDAPTSTPSWRTTARSATPACPSTRQPWMHAGSRRPPGSPTPPSPHFWSPAERIFHDAPADGEALLVRPRDIMDNATPSGNSLAVELLVRLSALTGSAEHRGIADAVFDRERGAMERYPAAGGPTSDCGGAARDPPTGSRAGGIPAGSLGYAGRGPSTPPPEPDRSRAATRAIPRSPCCPPWRADWTTPERPSSAWGRRAGKPVSDAAALDAALARAHSGGPAG